MTAIAHPHWRSVWKRRVAKYARWLHIYVSMASFVLVFFFSATGLTLNHPDWFSGAQRTVQAQGTVDPAWTNAGGADVKRLEIVEALRRTHHISGAVSDVEVDEGTVSIGFKGPGYTADVQVDRQTGRYDLTETRLGFVAVVNDLHKGRDSGAVWKLLIDLSAGLLAFVSLTGLILIYFIHKHRTAGIVILLLGGGVATLLYLVWVP